jgi:hypothetical protein
VFFTKEKSQFRPNLLATAVVFNDGREPGLFLIPATCWSKPDGILVVREYGFILAANGWRAELSDLLKVPVDIQLASREESPEVWEYPGHGCALIYRRLR